MLSNLKIPKQLRRKIENELHSGEAIRWVEQPIPRFTAPSIAGVWFGIGMTISPIVYILDRSNFQLPDLREGLQLQHLISLISPYWLLFCSVAGFEFLSSPIWKWQATRKTVYLVTNRRAISIQGGLSTKIRSYLPDQLKDVYRKERADGTGDVIIRIRRWRYGARDQKREEEIGFLGVRNPREVENIIKQLADNNA
jgi:hypothetical protein